MDYPRFAAAVARARGIGRTCEFGVMVDGAGIGSAMAANKVPGVLAAACYNEALARNSREHNDANVLTLGRRPDAAPRRREGDRGRVPGHRAAPPSATGRGCR